MAVWSYLQHKLRPLLASIPTYPVYNYSRILICSHLFPSHFPRSTKKLEYEQVWSSLRLHLHLHFKYLYSSGSVKLKWLFIYICIYIYICINGMTKFGFINDNIIFTMTMSWKVPKLVGRKKKKKKVPLWNITYSNVVLATIEQDIFSWSW